MHLNSQIVWNEKERKYVRIHKLSEMRKKENAYKFKNFEK